MSRFLETGISYAITYVNKGDFMAEQQQYAVISVGWRQGEQKMPSNEDVLYMAERASHRIGIYPTRGEAAKVAQEWKTRFENDVEPTNPLKRVYVVKPMIFSQAKGRWVPA